MIEDVSDWLSYAGGALIKVADSAGSTVQISDQVGLYTMLHSHRGYLELWYFGYGNIRYIDMSRIVRKPVFGVSDHVRHKPGCTTTEDGKRLEISDLGSRGIVLYI